MAIPDTIKDAIDQRAREGVRDSRWDNGSQELRRDPLSDLIEAAQYLAGEEAGNRNHLGLRFSQLVPPAAGGQQR